MRPGIYAVVVKDKAPGLSLLAPFVTPTSMQRMVVGDPEPTHQCQPSSTYAAESPSKLSEELGWVEKQTIDRYEAWYK